MTHKDYEYHKQYNKKHREQVKAAQRRWRERNYDLYLARARITNKKWRDKKFKEEFGEFI